MALYSRDRARRSLLHTVTFRASSQVATAIGHIVSVRSMSKSDFGVFNLLYSLIPVLATVASLGLEQTLRRFQPEYLQAGNQGAAAWLARFIARSRLISNTIALAIILLAWQELGPLFKLTPYRGEFALFCVVIVLYFQTLIQQLVLASHMLHRWSVGSTCVLSITKLVGYTLCAQLQILTLRNIILADIAAYSLTYVFLRIACWRYCPAPAGEPFTPDRAERRRLLRYGAYNNFNDAGSLVLGAQTDNFFIAACLNPIAVGAYSFYTRLNDMVTQLQPTRLFENVVQPMFFAIPRADANRRIPRDFSLLLNANLLLQWPILAFTVAYHAEIVTVIFGGKFIEYSWLLPLTVGFATINAIANPVSLVAQYQEKPGILLLSKIFAIYNIVAILLLLPLWGLYGAAFASGSAQVMKNVFIWWHVRGRAVWTNAAAVLLAGSALWGAAICICFALKTLVPAPAFVQMIMGGVVCAVVLFIYIRGPAISSSDRSILAFVLGKQTRIRRWLGLQVPTASGPP
jgi:O-antigen/teichoic acid export membrane protein